MHFAYIFNVFLDVKQGDNQLMLLVSKYVSSSYVMVWGWRKFRVETSCHTNKNYLQVNLLWLWIFLVIQFSYIDVLARMFVSWWMIVTQGNTMSCYRWLQ